MKSVNKVILIGNLGGKPDYKSLSDTKALATVTLATNENWVDKEAQEKKQKTEWHRLVFFNQLADVAHNHLKQGMAVYVEGKLQTRKWQDAEGRDRYMTEVVVNDVSFLSSNDKTNKPDTSADFHVASNTF